MTGNEHRVVKFHVLVNDDRAGVSVRRAHEAQLPAFFRLRECLLIISGGKALAGGQHPDLQKMYRLGLRVIEFAVPDAGPGRHDLHVSGPDYRTGTEAVLVLERAIENI